MRGSVAVITPPVPVLDVETVRSRLGLSIDDGDGTDLQAYIEAATNVLDAPDGWLGRAIGRQTLEWSLQSLGLCNSYDYIYRNYNRYNSINSEILEIPFPPILTINSVTYLDRDGVLQTIDPSLYAISDRRLRPAYGTFWPSGRIDDGSVKIRYVAGYDKVPAPILQAIVLMVGKMKSLASSDLMMKTETVAGVGSTSWSASDLPTYDKAINDLLTPYRVLT